MPVSVGHAKRDSCTGCMLMMAGSARCCFGTGFDVLGAKEIDYEAMGLAPDNVPICDANEHVIPFLKARSDAAE